MISSSWAQVAVGILSMLAVAVVTVTRIEATTQVLGAEVKNLRVSIDNFREDGITYRTDIEQLKSRVAVLEDRGRRGSHSSEH